MTEILVTGGNGFLGRHVVKALRERRKSVRVLALRSEDTSSLEMQGIDVYRGDIRDPGAIGAAMTGVEGVLHLAGMMGLWRPMEDYRAVNVTGTENVCRAALAEGARVVHVSSWTVYGMGLGEPVREDRPLRPLREPYARTKAEGEVSVQRMIAEDQLRAVIIRPGTIFGPGSTLNFGRIADRLRAGGSSSGRAETLFLSFMCPMWSVDSFSPLTNRTPWARPSTSATTSPSASESS
jgi:nucleoside-diphosphate-sugar epimerase